MLSVSSKNLCNKSLSASAAASIIGNNSDLSADILFRLPVKSVCLFKTVSKQWLSLISDANFERNYNLRNRRLSMPALFMKKLLITFPGCAKESEFETLVMDEQNGADYVPSHIPIAVTSRSRIDFEQSCNGLVLYEFHDAPNGCHKTYVIYNPSMKHFKTLPSPPFRKTRVPYVLGVTIAFDPSKSSYYEVVCVCKADTNEHIYHIEIYSSKTDSWRDAGDPFSLSPPGNGILCHSGVYWNGSVHWIDRFSATLHYLDIDGELMKKIAMPTQPDPLAEYYWEFGYFRECRGHIHLTGKCKRDRLCFHIWEMRVDYSGWNVKYYVDLTPLTTAYPSIVPDNGYFLLRFKWWVLLVEECEDSSRLILRIEKSKVISYDLKDKSFKAMYDVKPDVWVEGFEYMETLAHA